MCTAYSTWQHLKKARRGPAVVARGKRRADKHLDFVCQLYREQVEGGRLFLHEQPGYASSWDYKEIKDLLSIPESIGSEATNASTARKYASARTKESRS